MRRVLNVSIPILCVLILTKCAPMWEGRPPAQRPSEVMLAPPVEPSLIQERIDRITKALERKDLTVSERTTLYSLLEAYRQIKNPPPNMNERKYYRDSTRRLFYSLNALEELYLSRRPQLGGKASSVIGAFSEKVNEILDAYLSENYKTVIDLCINLKETFGPDALTPEIGLVFALSLAHQGMLKDAIAIGEQIANKLQTRPDLIVLRINLARWHLKVGDKEAALRNYEKAQDLLDERQREKARLTAYLRSLPSKIPAKESSWASSTVESQQNVSEGQAASVPSLDQFLAQIQVLVEDRKFERARELLKKRRHQTTSQKELQRLSEAIKEVDSKEDQFLQERISVLSAQSQVLKEAESLVENERYDEALSKLTLLNEDSVDNIELARLKNAAIQGIINQKRNKAARLFLAAKKSEDPEKKERYLRSCLEILKSLVERFPSSPLIYKVKDHIQKVTAELEKLG